MKMPKHYLLSAAFIVSLTALGFAAAHAQAEGQAAGSAQPAEDVIRPKVTYSAQDLRDPFAMPGQVGQPEQAVVPAEKKPLPQLEVQGVIWGGNLPQAIINNKVVKEGDTIEGVKIKSIAKEGIIVLFEGSESAISSPAAGPGAGTKPQGG